MRGKWEGEIERENEKETERGLHALCLPAVHKTSVKSCTINTSMARNNL